MKHSSAKRNRTYNLRLFPSRLLYYAFDKKHTTDRKFAILLLNVYKTWMNPEEQKLVPTPGRNVVDEIRSIAEEIKECVEGARDAADGFEIVTERMSYHILHPSMFNIKSFSKVRERPGVYVRYCLTRYVDYDATGINADWCCDRREYQMQWVNKQLKMFSHRIGRYTKEKENKVECAELTRILNNLKDSWDPNWCGRDPLERMEEMWACIEMVKSVGIGVVKGVLTRPPLCLKDNKFIDGAKPMRLVDYIRSTSAIECMPV